MISLKMKKVKLIGISKSKLQSIYTLKKSPYFFQGFTKFLSELDFKELDYYGFGRKIDKKYGEPYLDRFESINKYIDLHHKFKNKDFSINVVFGRSKIFIIINTKKDKQQFISNKIIKFCKYLKEKKKIRSYN